MRRLLDRVMARLGYVRRPAPPRVIGTVTNLEEARQLTESMKRTYSILDAEIQALREERRRS